MKVSPKAQLLYPLVAFSLLVLASLACGSSTTEQLSQAASQSEVQADTSAPVIPQAQAPSQAQVAPQGHVSSLIQAPSPTQEPSQAQEPLPTQEPSQAQASSQVQAPPVSENMQSATLDTVPLQLGNVGFGQDSRSIGYAFFVENPNQDAAIEDTRYQAAAYNAEGIVVETDSGHIELLLPGQRLGIASTIFVDEDVSVARIDIQLNDGDAVRSEQLPAFGVNAVRYAPDDYFSSVTGIVTNPFERDITHLRVSAITYDANGNINGSGFTYINFILGNSSTGIEVGTEGRADVANVELYPALSGLSLLSREETAPEDYSPLIVTKTGFGQNGGHLGFGMEVNNPNGNYSVEDTRYRVTAYGSDGSVLETEEGHIEVLLPNQTLGVAGETYLDEGVIAERIEVQIKSGDIEASEALPFFTSENIAYLDEQFSQKITGIVTNPYEKDVTTLRISAITYDETGAIIGGGFTFLDFVPANGKSAVDISVATSRAPATSAIFASVSSLSDFE